MSVLVLSESLSSARLDSTEKENDDEEEEDDEVWLLRRLDESILRAEELELWQRYEQSIRAAEETQKQQIIVRIPGKRIRKGDRDTWSDMEEEEEGYHHDDNQDGASSKFPRKKTRRHELEPTIESTPEVNIASIFPTASNNKVIHGSVQGLEYVQASKLLPRNCLWINPNGDDKGNSSSRSQNNPIQISKSIVRNMADRFRKQHPLLPLVYYSGFRVELWSANPDAWRLVVRGYRKTVHLFHQTMLQKELVLVGQQSQQRQNGRASTTNPTETTNDKHYH
jgi:hypothetical protein